MKKEHLTLTPERQKKHIDIQTVSLLHIIYKSICIVHYRHVILHICVCACHPSSYTYPYYHKPLFRYIQIMLLCIKLHVTQIVVELWQNR